MGKHQSVQPHGLLLLYEAKFHQIFSEFGREARGLGGHVRGGEQVRNLLTLCEAHVDAAANSALVCFLLHCVTAHSHFNCSPAAPGSFIHKHALFMKQRMHEAL